ncbi:MAG: N-acetylmuramoyl-L-alanine amidase [Candidatus Omnitrophota bacterium]
MKLKINSALQLSFLILVLVLLASCTTPTRVSTSSTGAEIYEASSSNFAVARPYHVVAPGETLWRIGKMYDVDVETIKEANRIRNVRKVEIGQKIYIPGASPRKDIVTVYPNKKWKYIIIHHSATGVGNSMQFNASHLRKGWKGVGYHFVIDNGTCGKDDGQIETGPRWLKQEDGAHCKASDMNEKAIGICLVGNFSKRTPTRKQMKSLTYLVNTLRDYYNIPTSRIIGHGQVKGARTECPGKKFPMKKLKSRV